MVKYNNLDEFMDSLNDNKKKQVLRIKEYITEVTPNVTEHIKWNAPSFIYESEDRLTFNLVNKQGLVKLVFHMGATKKENKEGKPVMNDPFTIIKWVSDIRGYITFSDLADVLAKKQEIKLLVAEWLTLS